MLNSEKLCEQMKMYEKMGEKSGINVGKYEKVPESMVNLWHQLYIVRLNMVPNFGWSYLGQKL